MLRAINQRRGTNYDLQVLHINAASYGVPQIRERLFILASVDGRHIEMPPPTHGDGLEPFRTAWDALGDLDSDEWDRALDPRGKWAGLLKSIPEGMNYLWHTPRGGGEPLFGWRTRFWSFLLKLSKHKPSWTIQAEPGPATGPFHWRNRILSIEELARLQTFPDEFEFLGDRRSAHRQIGNAVPCAIGELLGLEIRRQLFQERRVRRRLRLIPERRRIAPTPILVSRYRENTYTWQASILTTPGQGSARGEVGENYQSPEFLVIVHVTPIAHCRCDGRRKDLT